MEKEIRKSIYGGKSVIEEITHLPNGDKQINVRRINGVLTDKYDNLKLKYVLMADKLLNLREFFEIIVGDRFQKKDYLMQLYTDYKQKRHCNSIEEVLKYAKQDCEHFIPNTFYKWHDRSLENLRCTQWMVFDFELRKSNGETFSPLMVYEIFNQTVGFPPTIIKHSKTGGNYHVFLQHTTINGSTESSYLFKRIQTKIAEIIGTDLGAIGANHSYSIPKNGEKIFYFANNVIDFEDLKQWWLKIIKEENKAKLPKSGGKVSSLTEYSVWNHEAIKCLQNNEYDGSRNQAGFTLALLYYALGKSETECKNYLLNEWYPCVSQVGEKYHLSALRASIRSAYSKKYAGPSKEKIEGLTGIEFNIKVIRGQYKREKLHNKKENREAIISYFRERGGIVEMTKKALVEDICKTQKSPLGKEFSDKSIERNLDKLKQEKVIHWETQGKGGNTKNKATEFTLREGIEEVTTTIIKPDYNVYVLGEVVNFN